MTDGTDGIGGIPFNLALMQKVEFLTCACCGTSTQGRQWYNCDDGFGLCPQCAKRLEEHESPEEILSCYGEKGVHYCIES